MAVGKLAPGKKRYSVTLTQATVERFQLLTKETALAFSLSSLCEGAIDASVTQLQTFKDRGTIKLSDIFNLIGQQMDLLQDDEGSKSNVIEKRDEKKPARKATCKL